MGERGTLARAAARSLAGVCLRPGSTQCIPASNRSEGEGEKDKEAKKAKGKPTRKAVSQEHLPGLLPLGESERVDQRGAHQFGQDERLGAHDQGIRRFV